MMWVGLILSLRLTALQKSKDRCGKRWVIVFHFVAKLFILFGNVVHTFGACRASGFVDPNASLVLIDNILILIDNNLFLNPSSSALHGMQNAA
jgi:hypothetical protein